MRHICLLIGATLLMCFGVSAEVTTPPSKTTFSKLQVCPAADKLSELTKLEGAQDPRTCFVECATNPICSVLYRTAGVCYFGTSDQQSSFFTLTVSPNTDLCECYAKGVRSKLVVLFDFRQGFTNLVSPGTYDATPHGAVARDDQGAHFLGTSTSDFIEVDTQIGSLVTKYLDYPSKFSFYAKVIRQTYYQASYHCLYDCANPDSTKMAYFGDRDKRAWVQHEFLSAATTQTRQSAEILPGTNVPLAISLAAVFHGNALNNFYFNGTDLPTEANQNWGAYDAPKCLRLGYNKDSTAGLKGHMICYAIAKAALSTAKLQQLDQICS